MGAWWRTQRNPSQTQREGQIRVWHCCIVWTIVLLNQIKTLTALKPFLLSFSVLVIYLQVVTKHFLTCLCCTSCYTILIYSMFPVKLNPLYFMRPVSSSDTDSFPWSSPMLRWSPLTGHTSATSSVLFTRILQGKHSCEFWNNLTWRRSASPLPGGSKSLGYSMSKCSVAWSFFLS